MGGRVAVVSTTPEKEEQARSLGAELCVGPGDVPSGDRLREWEGGADIVLATPPTIPPAPVNEAFGGVAPDGTMVVLGVGPREIRYRRST